MSDTMATHEASNVLRRFLLVLFDLQHEQLAFARRCARTLEPSDLRQLAREVYNARSKPGPAPSAVAELRGLARSIIRYGGPDAVRRDADPELVVSAL